MIVIIESPFNPTARDCELYPWDRADLLLQNIKYARLALLDSLQRGEAPYASHLLYTQVWSEDPEFRNKGIYAGLEFSHRADLSAHYVDLGVSADMEISRENASLIGLEVQERRLFDISDQIELRRMLHEMPFEAFPVVAAARARQV